MTGTCCPSARQLWLKHLETYIDFPPLQDPASYNLEQVMQQVQQMKIGGSQRLARLTRWSDAGARRVGACRQPEWRPKSAAPQADVR